MNEEKEVKKLLKENKNPKLIDKILESNKTEIIIKRIKDLSNSIKNLIVTKLKLNDEEKEGKLFLILFAVILFVMISIMTLILLTPLVGIHIIFSIIRYSILILYKIMKNKRYEIKKYLRHKFPKTNLFQEKHEFKTNTNFSDIIFKEIENLIIKMDKIKLTKEEKANIALRLKEIVLLVKKEDGSLERELYNLEIKQKIVSSLSDIEFILNEYKKRETDIFYNTKDDLLENLENIIEDGSKIYRKI